MNTFGLDGGKRRLGETVLALVIERVRGKGGPMGLGDSLCVRLILRKSIALVVQRLVEMSTMRDPVLLFKVPRVHRESIEERIRTKRRAV